MSAAAALTLSELRTIDLFDDLDNDQLGEWLAVARVRVAPAGEIVAEHGVVPAGVFLLLEGTMLTFLIWLLLLLLCWPLALAALILYPIVWLLALPFRLVGITLEGVFRLLAAIILLPARLLRGPRGARMA